MGIFHLRLFIPLYLGSLLCFEKTMARKNTAFVLNLVFCLTGMTYGQLELRLITGFSSYSKLPHSCPVHDYHRAGLLLVTYGEVR